MVLAKTTKRLLEAARHDLSAIVPIGTRIVEEQEKEKGLDPEVAGEGKHESKARSCSAAL